MIVVAPAPRAVTSITIVDAATRTWTERRVGPDVRRDRVVSPPARAAASPVPSDPADAGATVTGRPSPRESVPAASPSASGTQRSPAGTPSSPPGSVAPGGRDDAPNSASGLTDRNTGTTAEEPPPAEDAPDPDPVPDPARDLSLDLSLDPSDPGASDPGLADPDASDSGLSVPRASDPGAFDPGTSDAGPSGPADPGKSGPGLSDPDTSADAGPPDVPGIPGLPDGGGLIPDDPPAARSGTAPARPSDEPGG